jgi:hypothetical protein
MLRFALFVVRYGHVLGAVMWLAIVALAFAGVRRLRRARDAKRARAEVQLRLSSINGPRPGPIQILGILHGEWIDCEDERVDLDGTRTIIRGDGGAWKRRGDKPTYTIDDGAGVVACGVMRRGASGTGGEYRESAGGWVLGPTAEGTIEVCAAEPVGIPRPLGVVRSGLLAIAFGFVTLVAMTVVGLISDQRHFYDDAPRSMHGLGRLVFASMMPFQHDRAPEHVLNWLEERAPRTPEVIAAKLELAREHSPCNGNELLMLHGRYEEVASHACAQQVWPVPAIYTLGRYDEYAKLPVDADRDPIANAHQLGFGAIAAGDWKAAADIARREAALLDKTPPRSRGEGTSLELSCMADLFALYAGDVAALQRLRERSAADNALPEGCEAARYLAEQTQPDHDLAWNTVPAGPLFWLTARAGTPSWPSEFLSLDAVVSNRRWLEPYLLEPDELQPYWLGLGAMDRGDFAEAKRQLALVPPDPNNSKRQLADEIALRDGEPSARDVAERLVEHDGPRALAYYTHVSGCKPIAEAALPDILAGNGDSLADLIERCSLEVDADPELFLALAQRVTTGKARVATALANLEGLPPSPPMDALQVAASRRDLARAYGDTVSAKRWQDIVDRHARVLADKQRFLALLVWTNYQR